MPKYALTIIKTYNVVVTAESKMDAYDAVHNRDEWESRKCVNETTERISKMEEENNGLRA